MMRGTVKFFNSEGWGYIAPEQGNTDVFLGRGQLELAGIADVVSGQVVEYVPVAQLGREQDEATQLRLVGGDPIDQVSRRTAPQTLDLDKSVTDEAQIQHLWDWAYFHDTTVTLGQLAARALHETWDFGDEDASSHKFPILYNYLQYTYKRLFVEGKIERASDGERKYAAFNTGLVDSFYEPIIAVFQKNHYGGKQPWALEGFCVAGQEALGKKLVGFGLNKPRPAAYFSDASELLYRQSRSLSVDWPHVIIDGIERGRLPYEFLEANCRECLQAAEDSRDELNHARKAVSDANLTKVSEAALKNLQAEVKRKEQQYLEKIADSVAKDEDIVDKIKTSLEGALSKTLKRVEWNFKTAVPVWFPTKNCMSLLLPLCLVTRGKADAALVVEKKMPSKEYVGHTILTLHMAYMNARLVCRPDSDWLDAKSVDTTIE